MGIVPEVVMWRDVRNVDGVVYGEMSAQTYSIEPEILMQCNGNTLQGISYIMIDSGVAVLVK